ncbi:hypothetical protein BB558_004933 [Smittium angustum]|uniref:Fanconi Anaemia group E protein C-terminal domain-containing protein n=1 Tax=Smittium angustum TaxID=133377 RepID=A0A2U1J1W4_SMIAN|nr:hypothetical protein BB558_004933 [Smittium angustum]
MGDRWSEIDQITKANSSFTLFVDSTYQKSFNEHLQNPLVRLEQDFGYYPSFQSNSESKQIGSIDLSIQTISSSEDSLENLENEYLKLCDPNTADYDFSKLLELISRENLEVLTNTLKKLKQSRLEQQNCVIVLDYVAHSNTNKPQNMISGIKVPSRELQDSFKNLCLANPKLFIEGVLIPLIKNQTTEPAQSPILSSIVSTLPTADIEHIISVWSEGHGNYNTKCTDVECNVLQGIFSLKKHYGIDCITVLINHLTRIVDLNAKSKRFGMFILAFAKSQLELLNEDLCLLFLDIAEKLDGFLKKSVISLINKRISLFKN